jgi:hypothetical protein
MMGGPTTAIEQAFDNRAIAIAFLAASSWVTDGPASFIPVIRSAH